MIVCICKGISDKTIRFLVQNGAKCLRDVMMKCNAASDCGSCACDVKALVEKFKAEEAEQPAQPLTSASNE